MDDTATTYKIHWSFVLNTRDKTKATRILKPFGLYENLVIEKFIDESDGPGIKAFLDVPLTSKWPDVVVEALQRATKVGVPSCVFISPEGTASSVEGVIATPSMVGVTWAGWSLVWQ